MKPERVASAVLDRMLVFYPALAFLYCEQLSEALGMEPLVLGLLCVVCLGLGAWAKLGRAWREKLLGREQKALTAGAGVLIAAGLALTVLWAARQKDLPNAPIGLLLLLLFLAPPPMSEMLEGRRAAGRIGKVKYHFLLALLVLVPCAVSGAVLLALGVEKTPGHMLNYLLFNVIEVENRSLYFRDMDGTRPAKLQADAPEKWAGISRRRAFRLYQLISGLTAAGFTSVILMLPLYESVSQPMPGIIIALLAAGAGMQAVKRLFSRKPGDPANTLLIGLIANAAGLLLLPSPVLIWTGLVLCVIGGSISLTSLDGMERQMTLAALFSGIDRDSFSLIRHASLQLGELLGITAALALHLCSVLLLPQTTLLPLLILLFFLPAIGLLCRFPVTEDIAGKLSRMLAILEAGGKNLPLEKQLREKLEERGPHQPFGTRLIKSLVRLAAPHRKVGFDRIRLDPENPIVFLCNHGELYGPLISVAFLPVPARIWSIDRVMNGLNEVTAYLYKYTFSRQKWLLPPLRRPIAKLAARLLIWVTGELGAVPVYRDQPGKLMGTFRASVEALQAGDNLLIYPENPNAEGQDHGYEQSGLGELFSGFTMLAPIYWRRTGKRCRFLPMYANKHTRVISLGTEIVWDPDADPHDETERVVREARGQMIRMMEESSAAGEKGRKQRE